jgi:cytochrome c553
VLNSVLDSSCSVELQFEHNSSCSLSTTRAAVLDSSSVANATSCVSCHNSTGGAVAFQAGNASMSGCDIRYLTWQLFPIQSTALNHQMLKSSDVVRLGTLH